MPLCPKCQHYIGPREAKCYYCGTPLRHEETEERRMFLIHGREFWLTEGEMIKEFPDLTEAERRDAWRTAKRESSESPTEDNPPPPEEIRAPPPPEGEFGEVIYRYGLEQAIADGIIADFGYVDTANPKMGAVQIVATTHLMDTINAYQALNLILSTLNNMLVQRNDMLIWEKGAERHFEDEGRTLVLPFETEEKIYARFERTERGNVITLMFASDY